MVYYTRMVAAGQRMVGVAQLVERWLVEPDVAGSSPVVHPKVSSNELPGYCRAVFVVCKAGWVSQTMPLSDLREQQRLDLPWVTIVWNDPVNLMSYVAWVFRSYFGVERGEAQRLMLQVHNDGRAVVATGGREEMERHVQAMHGYGLWATLQQVDE